MKNIDFTANTGKKLFNALCKAYDAYFVSSKAISDDAKVLRNNKTAMDNAKARLDAVIDMGGDVAKYQSAYDVAKELFDKVNDRLTKTKEVQAKRLAEAIAFFDTDAVYDAYCELCKSGDDSMLASALADILSANGITATADAVLPYIRRLGAVKASVYKTKATVKAMGKKQAVDFIVRLFCDALANAGKIDTTKYAYYVKPVKADKSAK